MAFQQPQRPRPTRPLSFSQPAQQQPAEPAPVSPQRKHSIVESEEWVLFSPSVDGRTHTTSTERTPRTAGISQLSDFGSLETAARSEGDEERDDDDDLTCQRTDPEDEGDAETLDSLDDGLHAFHEPSLNAQQIGESSQTVFPTHDGLGTFPVNSAAVQEQLWQFERYNASPRKTKVARRRSSVQRRLDSLEETEAFEHDERRERIERWRLEQSRALLEEIERETRRRRRMSRASIAKSTAGSVVGESSRATTQPGPSATEATRLGASNEDSTESESFWQRFTRRVIRDLMGIDENILSVIFGEALPAEASAGPSTSMADPKDILAAAAAESGNNPYPGESWEHRLLERISRELGILVNQLSEHPGAFTTYLRTQETPTYAGLPSTNNTATRRQSIPASTPGATPTSAQSQSISNINFAPTVPPQPTSYSEASLWGIEEEPEPEPAPFGPADAATQAQHEREYWERDLDVKMVFNFLKERFSSRPTSPVNGRSPNRRDNGEPFQPKNADSSAGSQERAALIRQHHPLTSRNLPTSSGPGNSELTSSRPAPNATTTITVPVPMPVSRANLQRSRLSNRNAGSSCASQSTRKSKRSGSSRNYWDLGGSVGSGPAGAPGAATWGEV